MDRKQFLELLANYRKRQAFRLFAFVLMTNHIHLLLETGPVPLSKTRQQILGYYTRYFNRRHHKVFGRGSLIFQLCNPGTTSFLLIGPMQLYVIGGKLLVGCQEGELFELGLSNQ